MSIIDATDGWLTDWSQEGGRFKEWVRGLSLNSINHGWVSTLISEPGHWWRSFCHVLSWLPFLWDDRDFDQAYLWKMMREKLRRMRQHQETCGISADAGKVAEEIKVAETVLDRLLADAYTDADWAEHERRFGSLKSKWVLMPDGSMALPSSHDTEEGADTRRISERGETLRQADSAFLGKWLAEHWFGWWD